MENDNIGKTISRKYLYENTFFEWLYSWIETDSRKDFFTWIRTPPELNSWLGFRVYDKDANVWHKKTNRWMNIEVSHIVPSKKPTDQKLTMLKEHIVYSFYEFHHRNIPDKDVDYCGYFYIFLHNNTPKDGLVDLYYLDKSEWKCLCEGLNAEQTIDFIVYCLTKSNGLITEYNQNKK